MYIPHSVDPLQELALPSEEYGMRASFSTSSDGSGFDLVFETVALTAGVPEMVTAGVLPTFTVGVFTTLTF